MNARAPRLMKQLLAVSLLSTCFLDYWGYSRTFYAEPGAWMDVVHGTADAPQQYRVGVVRTAYWMTRHLHMGMRHAFTILDLIAVMIAGFLLLGLLEHSDVFQRASRSVQWFGAAGFVVLLNFYLIWLLWYQRAETLPSTAVLAVMLWLWTPTPGSQPSAIKNALTMLCLIALAAFQGLVRADVACLLNAGIFLAALTPIGTRLSLPRTLVLLTSFAGAAVAAAIQVYMMKVVYPHATYGSSPVFELKLNLLNPLGLLPFALFMTPVIWTIVQAGRRRFTEDAAAIALLVGALAFFVAWIVLGRLEEVRIFMPFAIAIVPLTVELAMLRAVNDNQRVAQS